LGRLDRSVGDGELCSPQHFGFTAPGFGHIGIAVGHGDARGSLAAQFQRLTDGEGDLTRALTAVARRVQVFRKCVDLGIEPLAALRRVQARGFGIGLLLKQDGRPRQ